MIRAIIAEGCFFSQKSLLFRNTFLFAVLSDASFGFIPFPSRQTRFSSEGRLESNIFPRHTLPLSGCFFRLRLSYSLFRKSISSKIGLTSSVMKGLVYHPHDKSNLWLPAFQTLGTSGKKDSSFSLEIRIDFFSYFEGRLKKVCMLWNKPTLSLWEMRFRSFRHFLSLSLVLPQPFWAKIGDEASSALLCLQLATILSLWVMTETPLVDAHTAHLSELENKTVIGCLKSLPGFKRCGLGLLQPLFLVWDNNRKEDWASAGTEDRELKFCCCHGFNMVWNRGQ